MRLISERSGRRQMESQGRGGRLRGKAVSGLLGRWKSYAGAAMVVATAAALGAAAVDADSAWYRGLATPRWQPPSWAFAAIWAPLYASIAWSAGHAWNQADEAERTQLAAALTVNLSLNTAWSWAFFAARSPGAGLVGTLLLDASNLQLIRTTSRTDRLAAAALLPYAAWCWFATALNAKIARADLRT
ncbi:TspO/MBR family protein [Streptomyces sp. NPDC058691]|uniref:TspO/MBR family protein n=1 Tax=Streptomyces sp. NPDC058691 TaxID=3346601 RepID=UPI003668D8B2